LRRVLLACSCAMEGEDVVRGRAGGMGKATTLRKVLLARSCANTERNSSRTAM